ncbi:endolytic transglycosylase MltG [Streptomyces sp. NPDC059443]|uniref:endolytic transglycosylase MltG n=1 Tax=unclassified Streptomyces TaxID=2593676 RepID=UPI0036784057
MTEYGRGPGPQPWHPEDPQYGDQGWTGHEAQQGQQPYVDDPQQQPQHPHYVQQQPQHPQYVQQHPGQYQQAPYPQGQQPHAQQPQAHQPQYVQQQVPHPQQHQETYGGQGWDTGQAQAQAHTGMETHPGMEYVGVSQATDPYAGAEPYAQQQAGGYPGETPDLYGTPDAFPPPQPPGRRHLEPEAQWQDEDVKTDEAEESFLGGGGRDGGDGGDDGEPGGRRSGRSGGKPKKRSGMACLIAAVVIVGVLGGGGYYGYNYIKDKFGAAEDYAGSGTDETVSVEIPKGSGLGQMGRILKDAGVVASAQAFVNAANSAPDGKGKAIQPGIYPLKKKMSAASVVAVMTDPTKLRVITVTEGMRNTKVYTAIDEKLGKPAGTTQGIAKNEAKNLGLPAWANNDPKIMDPLEGFLYPARYDLTNESTPESLLKQMVKKATDKYTELGVEGKAKDLGLSNPLQVITVASLVNAEGMNHDDFRKMADVVYNRLKKTNDVTNQKIEFDSTYNYIKNQSEINFNLKEAQAFDHPYNTHHVKGLPPGPIGNPGLEALTATLDPDRGGWMFFVSVDGKTTTFSKTYDEHLKLVAEFQERQKQKNGG